MRHSREDLVRAAFQLVGSEAKPFVAPAFNGEVYAANVLSNILPKDHLWNMAVLMWWARVDKPAFREFFGAIWRHNHRAMGQADSRNQIAAMFKYADFPLPHYLPNIFTIYRGTHGINSKTAAMGFSWTTDLNIAKWFAFRYRAHFPLVVSTKISIEDVDYYTNERREKEVVIICPPKVFTEIEVTA